MIDTLDPNVFILEQTENRIVYQTNTGEKWEIIGTCNACGECEVGAHDIYYEKTNLEDKKQNPPEPKKYQIWTGVPIGQPGACLDARFENRLDIPVRPELTKKMTNCSLSGRYLNGN